MAASYLGKSTNSFVKKLRAPKIDNIGKYTSEVKGAKVIVIHTGINNLREKESTSTAILNLKEAVSSLEKAAPGTKFLFSKVAPVGERSLEIERNLLNAEAEKTFSVTRDGHVSYIDHSNLADRGPIIKDYYKPDELHLSKDGIYRYTENLKDAIQNALRGKQGTSNDAKRQPTEFLSGRIRHRTSSSEEKRYRRDGNRDHYVRDGFVNGYTPRKQRQHNYKNSDYRSYDDERAYKSYNYEHYDHTPSNERRRRDDNDSYYENRYNSYRRYHGDRGTLYDDGRSDYYDREHTYRHDYY